MVEDAGETAAMTERWHVSWSRSRHEEVNRYGTRNIPKPGGHHAANPETMALQQKKEEKKEKKRKKRKERKEKKKLGENATCA